MFLGLISVFCFLLISKTCVLAGNSEPCITSCVGLYDGNYHSCNGCQYYASCVSGVLYNDRPCPGNLEYDYYENSCIQSSTSCDLSGPQPQPKPPSPSNCISSCAGKADGNYGSCIACHKFATCSSGAITDDQLCPNDKVWDNSASQCLDISSTCNCIRKCDGLPDGNFHSCTSCEVFASCSGGNIVDDRPCGANMQFDSRSDACKGTSSTCP